FFIILLLGGSMWAQPAAWPEKVYVHLDRTYFAAGETIWLKAYVEDELPDEYSSLFLYVELLEPGKKEAVLRAKIRRGDEGFAGHLDLPEELPGGRYLLRAYTRWQLNWPEESLFRVPIDVYDGNNLVVVDSGKQAMRESSSAVPLAISWEEPVYEPRKRWNLQVSLPESVAADSAEVSVSVVRSAFRPYQQEDDLASCFAAGIPAGAGTDSAAAPRFYRERTQSLRGEIRSVLGKRPRNYTFTLICPSQNSTQVVPVKRGSRFVVDSLDFADGTLFLLHIDNDGEVKRYYPVIEETFASAPAKWPASAQRLPAGTDSVRLGVAQPEAVIPFEPGDVQRDTIRTAIIQDVAPRIKTPFGTSDIPNIKKREELSSYDNRTLFDYILMNYSNLEWDEENGQMTNRKTGVINKNGVSYSTVSLFVDGFSTNWEMAQMIMMSDVDRLSVTTNLTSDALLARSYGGIVLVQLRVDAGQKSLLQQSNTILATPLGWQEPKDFPDPVKDRRRSLSIPDRRNTVYWNPSVRLRAGETVTLPLMTEDRADGPYYLRIEGRTSDGRWISETRLLDGKQ
ncbi:MAG: hypothetical protein J5702_02615, partial [Bacteroidales bacterium]|nr:hypothetical protein [Bacteroidales bacterium]